MIRTLTESYDEQKSDSYFNMYGYCIYNGFNNKLNNRLFMLTIEQIIKKEPVYLHDFKCKFDVVVRFEGIFLKLEEYQCSESPWYNEEYWDEEKEKAREAIDKYANKNILFASYSHENYSGDAWVLFEENNKLYEIHASHCSCYGLENQWEAEEVVLSELFNRLTKGEFGIDTHSGNEFKEELLKFLEI